MWWSSSSRTPLCPSLLSFACMFILFYQELSSVFVFADVRAHARSLSLCLLFVFITAAGTEENWFDIKPGTACCLDNKHVERER